MLKILPGAVDKSLTDSIQRTLSKPAVVDHLSKGIASSMQPVINEGFRNAFKDVLIPGFQRATTAMFEQIHASFENGVVQCEFQNKDAIAVYNPKANEEVFSRSSSDLEPALRRPWRTFAFFSTI
jgi:hypothetical protein